MHWMWLWWLIVELWSMYMIIIINRISIINRIGRHITSSWLASYDHSGLRLLDIVAGLFVGLLGDVGWLVARQGLALICWIHISGGLVVLHLLFINNFYIFISILTFLISFIIFYNLYKTVKFNFWYCFLICYLISYPVAPSVGVSRIEYVIIIHNN